MSIAGVLDKHDIKGILSSMANILKHEDSYNTDKYTSHRGNIGITQVSRSGKKLISNRDGTVIIMLDGEIYDFGRQAKNKKDDAEILLYLYEQCSLDFVATLSGWFNFVMYDSNRDVLVLANDRFGFKPLYYSHLGDRTLFASEIKAILAGGNSTFEIDDNSVADFLVFGAVFNERTLFRNIYRLPPAQIWLYKDEQLSKQTYWKPNALLELPKLSVQDSLDAGSSIFKQVLKRYLKGDSERIRISLTGGYDTRAIVSNIASGSLFKFYTYGVNPYSADAKIARRIVNMIGGDYEFLEITPGFLSDFSKYAERTVYISDGTSSIFNSHVLFLFQKLSDSICLTGKYGTQLMRGVASRVFQMNEISIMDLVSDEYKAIIQGFPNNTLETAANGMKNFSESEKQVLFGLLNECRHLWVGNLRIEEAYSAIRTPYTDNSLVELYFTVPQVFRTSLELQEHIIRKGNPSLAKIPTNRGRAPLASWTNLPGRLWLKSKYQIDLVANSRKLPPRLKLELLPIARQGTARYRMWSRRELKDFFRDILFDKRTLARGYFDGRKLPDAVTMHMNRERDFSIELGKIITLELFHRQFLDQKVADRWTEGH